MPAARRCIGPVGIPGLDCRLKRAGIALALLQLACGLLLSLAAAGSARAQAEWPQKAVRLIVPYAPGGTADLLGRLVASRLRAIYKQNFIVENRPGAGGTIGSLALARAAADGYTFGISGIGSHVIGPALAATGYDPADDFSHVALLGGPPAVFVVDPGLPLRDLAGFLSFAAAREPGVSWGSPGQGSHGHLIGELFFAATRLSGTEHIGYKGGAPAMTDLIGGQVQAAFVAYPSAIAHINSGRVRALGVTSARRNSDLRDVPTFAELGYAQLTASTWFAFSGPGGLPRELVEQLNLHIRTGLQQADAKKILAREGIEPFDLSAAELSGFLAAETKRWKARVGALNKDPKSRI